MIPAQPGNPPPREAEIRALALRLPQAWEVTYHDAPWFQIGKKSFVLYSPKDGAWIFKLPKPLQARLFDERPETFVPMRSGALLWSYVVVEHLDAEELRDLITLAWREVVPKRVAAAFDASEAARGTPA